MMDKKQRISMSMQDVKDVEMRDLSQADEQKIQNIILEKNSEKNIKIKKEALKAANIFESFNGFINHAFRGLIGILDATSSVLESVGDIIPVIGFVFPLLGEGVKAISDLLNSTTSPLIKALSLLVLPLIIPLIGVGIAFGPLSMAAISIATLGFSAIKKSAKLGEHLADYFFLTNKLEKLKSVKKNEDGNSPSKKLDQLHLERERMIKNYTNDLILFKTFPSLLAGSIEGGVQNLAKTHRKALMEIDQKIEEISYPEETIERQLSHTKKDIINTTADILLVAGSLSLIFIALPAIIAGAPVVVPTAIGLGITIGVIGVCKMAANWTINYLDKAAVKEKKQEKKAEIQQEVLKTYQNQSKPNCVKVDTLSPPPPAVPAPAAHHHKSHEEPKESRFTPAR